MWDLLLAILLILLCMGFFVGIMALAALIIVFFAPSVPASHALIISGIALLLITKVKVK
jgi:hypothetical protein